MHPYCANACACHRPCLAIDRLLRHVGEYLAACLQEFLTSNTLESSGTKFAARTVSPDYVMILHVWTAFCSNLVTTAVAASSPSFPCTRGQVRVVYVHCSVYAAHTQEFPSRWSTVNASHWIWRDHWWPWLLVGIQSVDTRRRMPFQHTCILAYSLRFDGQPCITVSRIE